MSDSGSGSVYQSANLHKYTADNRIYRWHLQAVMDQLVELIDQAQPGSLLDAGCGEGFVAGDLARRRPEIAVTGVDLSPEAIAYAQERFGKLARFRTGSVYKLPFSDRSFDLVLCSEVLEHLDEPEKAIAELKRVARSHVLITVPLEPYFDWLNRVGRSLNLSVDPGHVNFWTKERFQDFIRIHFDEPRFAWKHIYQFALARR